MVHTYIHTVVHTLKDGDSTTAQDRQTSLPASESLTFQLLEELLELPPTRTLLDDPENEPNLFDQEVKIET